MISSLIEVGNTPVILQAVIAIVAIAVLWVGAEHAAKYAAALAGRAGVSPLLIGLTVLSIASSLPEIFVNVAAVLGGNDDVAAGNVIGSCLVQITLVLGLCAVIAGGFDSGLREIRRDGLIVIAAALAMIVVISDDIVSVGEGLLLVAAYLGYIIFLVCAPVTPKGAAVEGGAGEATASNASGASGSDEPVTGPVTGPASRSIPFLLAATVMAVLAVWLMSDILVAVGKSTGEALGLSQTVIGLWVGVGTTFPELVVSVAAILRGSSALSVGNLFGSNVTDPLLSFGLGVLAGSGLSLSADVLPASIVWLAGTLLAVGLFGAKGTLSRLSGILLMVFYAGGQWLIMAW